MRRSARQVLRTSAGVTWVGMVRPSAGHGAYIALKKKKEKKKKKVNEESEEVGLKLNIQKTKIMASGPITSWEIDGETVESVRLNFFGLQNHCRW